MLAPKISKLQTRTAENLTARSAFLPAKVTEPRLRRDQVEQALLLQRTIGNRAFLRLLSQQTPSLAGNGCSVHQKQQPLADNTTAQEGRGMLSNEGRYRAYTTPGRRFLSHELAHFVQQGAATSRTLYTKQIHRLEDHTTPVQRQADSVAELDQAYKAAVEKPDWPTAAEKLNAFNYEDIQSRLAS